MLDRIPVHPAAHGHVRGRSPHTLAAEHRARPMVLRLDLEGFYSHVTGGRVAGLLLVAGYPPAVAAAVAGLLVTTTPPGVLRACPHRGDPAPRRRLLDRLAAPHLPQGAPSSPTVANLLTYGLDRRLSGLAAAVGAVYGRYADDLVSSGDATLPVQGLAQRAAAIARGGRLPRPPGQDPDHARAPPAEDRRARRERQRARGVAPRPRRAPRDPAQRGQHRPGRPEPGRAPRVPRAPAGTDRLGGHGRPARAARRRELFDRIVW